MANPADQLHLLLELAAPGADLLEPLHDHSRRVLQHRPVRRPERTLAKNLGRGAEQVLQIKRQRRTLKEHHPVAVAGLAYHGLGLRRLPPLLIPALPGHNSAPLFAAIPVAKRYQEHRDDGEHQDTPADSNGEDGRLAEPHPPLRQRTSRRRRQRRRREHRRHRRRPRHVVPGERGIREPQQGVGHGAVEMVVGEVEELERGEAEVGDMAGERVVGEVERDELSEVGKRAGEGPVEAVEGEIEHLEAPQPREPRRQRAGEGVALEVEPRERGEVEEVVGERAGEIVGAEAEHLQRGEAPERARRDGAREAEPREAQRDDAGAVGAAGDPGPGGADARGGGPVDARPAAVAHRREEVEQRRLVRVRLGGREPEAAEQERRHAERQPRRHGGDGGGAPLFGSATGGERSEGKGRRWLLA
uniref:Uncharacterized protein n=1 Tax=Arundo donax TaxID=35708 RepID=A0A0A9D9B1_ARUDO